MKKSNKALIAVGAFAMATCGLMAGCGAGQLDTMASVDKGGNWQTTSSTAVSTYVEKEETKDTIAKGYHYSYETLVTGTARQFMNVYITTDEDGKMDKAVIKYQYPRTSDTTKNDEMIVWYGNNTIFFEKTINGETTKTYITTTDGNDIFNYTATPDTNASDFLDNLSVLTSLQTSKFSFDVSQNDNDAKYRVKLNEQLEATLFGTTITYDKFELYVIYEDNQFVGASFEQKYSGTDVNDNTTKTLETKSAIVVYDGEISLPNATEFTKE